VDRGRKSVAKQRYLERSAYAQHQALLDQRACSRGTRVLEVMEAVERLRSIDPVLGDLVFLRYFEGLDLEATAERLGLSRRTAIRRWGFAKAFLKDRILFQEGAIPRSTTDGVANMDSLSKSPQ
jgi:DNA-directed RNA polymerase specialized sigma24 family protein